MKLSFSEVQDGVLDDDLHACQVKESLDMAMGLPNFVLICTNTGLSMSKLDAQCQSHMWDCLHALNIQFLECSIVNLA